MFLLTFLLIPAVLAVEHQVIFLSYLVRFEGSRVISVNPTTIHATPAPGLVLNFSRLGLQSIEENAFENLTALIDLNLGKNSLSSIPTKLFSKLENLEHLSLADNALVRFENTFKGLYNLKTLDISNNPLNHLDATALSGLPKSSIVFTKGLSLVSINAFVFENEPGPSFDIVEFYKRSISNDRDPTTKAQKQNESAEIGGRLWRDVDPNRLVKICVDGDVLESVQRLTIIENLPAHCYRDQIDGRKILDLKALGIFKLKEGWYQLNTTLPISQILLANNNIQRVTTHLVNDLPNIIRFVDLTCNYIRRLNNNVLENQHIKSLDLSSNAIRYIEDNVFIKMTGLTILYLDDNLLTNTNFTTTLPIQIEALFLNRNNITEISPRSFARSYRLRGLYLNTNLIRKVKADAFNSLQDLVNLELSYNDISEIEPEAFQRLTNLDSILLNGNSIVSFEIGTFDNLRMLTRLDVSGNKLVNIDKSFPDGLPPSLRLLRLRSNEIDKLKSGDFNNGVMEYLILTKNNISEIEHGAFRLPALKELKLDHNKLTRLDADSFRGLNIKKLELAYNNITTIPKGFTKNMPSLNDLNLSYNPIQRLQNGALYGFRKTAKNHVFLSGAPVESIEGGLFDRSSAIIQL